ncbi:hypothetical protein HDU97_002838 [Phlyctochytrium planicorne]|nr:hypothetical protein HDU97_002838 [Phlyctochytrium planicorne]
MSSADIQRTILVSTAVPALEAVIDKLKNHLQSLDSSEFHYPGFTGTDIRTAFMIFAKQAGFKISTHVRVGGAKVDILATWQPSSSSADPVHVIVNTTFLLFTYFDQFKHNWKKVARDIKAIDAFRKQLRNANWYDLEKWTYRTSTQRAFEPIGAIRREAENQLHGSLAIAQRGALPGKFMGLLLFVAVDRVEPAMI